MEQQIKKYMEQRNERQREHELAVFIEDNLKDYKLKRGLVWNDEDIKKQWEEFIVEFVKYFSEKELKPYKHLLKICCRCKSTRSTAS